MNKMLPILLLVVVVGAGAVLTLVFRSPDTSVATDTGVMQVADETPALPTTHAEVATVTSDTADRDDYVETVQTLSAQLNAVDTRSQTLEKTVSDLSDKLDETLDARITKRVDAARSEIVAGVEKTLDGNIKDWKKQLSALKTTVQKAGHDTLSAAQAKTHGEAGGTQDNTSDTSPVNADIPTGFGYDYPVNAQANGANVISIGGKHYVRLQPLSAASTTTVDGVGDDLLSPLSKLGQLGQTGQTKTRQAKQRVKISHKKNDIIKRYTIPDTATLVNSTSMTAMLGRVPFKGKLVSPFRFKVITGSQNLATNGHRIPGIKNIVWSGYAQGVREQECVRGFLDTVTYTFEDGTISTFSVKRQQHSGGGSQSQQYLAYISDPWGKPCIRGALYSNASQYLRDRILVATAAAASRASAASQTTTTQDASNNAISSFVSGDKTQAIAADAIAGGLDEATSYLRDIMTDAFDVVYIQTGQPLTINVEREIPIDYNPDGRKLAHEITTRQTPSRLD